jgi:hypothetical protein
MGGDLAVGWYRLRSNPAGVLPKLDVVTVSHSLGAFLCSVVIIADRRPY